MINTILRFLKDNLNNHLKMETGASSDLSGEDKVVFIDGEKMDPVAFKSGAVSVLLINIEEEKTLRSADPYMANLPTGTQKVLPEIRMNLYVLFVARFQKYEDSLRNLSSIIQYFQQQRVFDHQNAPDLPDTVDQIMLETTTQSLSEQNELWGALRTSYLPSILYKVRMVVFQDRSAPKVKEIKERTIKL
ncbi:MAG: DUF4255 domain-containing protein [Calditrichaeota bacterium]|nr:MAG: DUF4255 domain-containing protein [Calditrichota bacterium]